MDVCFPEIYFALFSFSLFYVFNPVFYTQLVKYLPMICFCNTKYIHLCNKVSGAYFTTEISYIGILITVWINHCGLQKTTD